MSLSSLVEGDEGCIGPSGKLLCSWKRPKNYATHSWRHSTLVWLSDQSDCSPPSTEELHEWLDSKHRIFLQKKYSRDCWEYLMSILIPILSNLSYLGLPQKQDFWACLGSWLRKSGAQWIVNFLDQLSKLSRTTRYLSKMSMLVGFCGDLQCTCIPHSTP